MQAPYHGVLLYKYNHYWIILNLSTWSIFACTIDSMCNYVHLDRIGQSHSTLNHTWWSAQWNEVILRAVATVLATSQDITLCSIQTYYICNVYIDCRHAQVCKWDIYIIIIYILPPLHTDQWQLNKAYHICSNLRAATKHGAASIWANTVIYM